MTRAFTNNGSYTLSNVGAMQPGTNGGLNNPYPIPGYTSHNINLEEVAQGIADWSAAKLSFEDGKIAISKQNFMLRVWTFATTFCPDEDLEFMDIVTRLLNSKKYVVTARMLMQSNNYNLAACNVQWKLINGKAITNVDTRLTAGPEGPRLSGTRFYSTGALFAHWIPTRAVGPDGGPLLVFVRRDAPGVRVADDWQGFGQRTTASGTVIFAQAPVEADLTIDLAPLAGRPGLFGPVSQLIHAAIRSSALPARATPRAAAIRRGARPRVV